MNPNGSDRTFVTSGYDPTWSPDGKRIAFTDGVFPNTAVYVVDSNGKNRDVLFNLQGYETNLVWSPDGTKIVLEYYPPVDVPFGETRPCEIYVVVVATGQYVSLVGTPAGLYRHPMWSPDGTRIAFAAGFPDDRIWTMDAYDGGNRVMLFDGLRRYDRPTWSPDRRHIACVSYDADTRRGEVLVVDVTGTGVPWLLFDSEHLINEPAWSPNGKQIAYVELHQIPAPMLPKYIVVYDLNSGRTTRITDDGWSRSPAWFDPDPFPLGAEDRRLVTWGEMKSP
ncbi:MAG: hypothetical protein O3A46_13750 [Candidatus Poribacteria bacterium]|nr:hypothetical protein [Candidatus Poribacteria bacterium]